MALPQPGFWQFGSVWGVYLPQWGHFAATTAVASPHCGHFRGVFPASTSAGIFALSTWNGLLRVGHVPLKQMQYTLTFGPGSGLGSGLGCGFGSGFGSGLGGPLQQGQGGAASLDLLPLHHGHLQSPDPGRQLHLDPGAEADESQALARFFVRVGLPEDIAPFK